MLVVSHSFVSHFKRGSRGVPPPWTTFSLLGLEIKSEVLLGPQNSGIQRAEPRAPRPQAVAAG